MLVWDETEMISVLEVLPEVNEETQCKSFTVSKRGLTLKIHIYPHEDDVCIELTQDKTSNTVFFTWLNGCPGIRVQEPDIQFIIPDVPGTIIVRDDVTAWKVGRALRLRVDPYISVEM